MNSVAMYERVSTLLGDRALFWFGTRGTDAYPLLSLEQFAGVFSMVAPLDSQAADLTTGCLESISNRRVDLNGYSIDDDRSESVAELYRAIVSSIRRPTAITAYRPSDFLASVCYPRQDLVDYLGLFHTRQVAFEHKAWVEGELSKYGVRTIPWRYYADYARADLEADIRLSDHRYSVIRANASDGGKGLVRVQRGEAFELPSHADHFLAVAPYLAPSLPLNVGCCIYPDGTLTLHGPSLQLIGVPECAGANTFAYCGNDFSAPASALDSRAIDELEVMARSVGTWLRSNGYVGAFGLDALFFEGQVYLTEVNPRFQGSSSTSAEVDEDLGRANIYLHHLAASMNAAGPRDTTTSLRELVVAQANSAVATSNVVLYNSTGVPVRLLTGASPESLTPSCTALGVPRTGVCVEPDAMLVKMRVHSGVTTDGYQIDKSTRELVHEWRSAFEPVVRVA